MCKLCENITMLSTPQERKHREHKNEVRFESWKCGILMEIVIAKIHHENTCMGGEDERHLIECEVCGEWICKNTYDRHMKSCRISRKRRTERKVKMKGIDKEDGSGKKKLMRKVAWFDAVGLKKHGKSCKVLNPARRPRFWRRHVYHENEEGIKTTKKHSVYKKAFISKL